MANEAKVKKAGPTEAPQAPQVAAAPAHCKMESCKKSVNKFGFCSEHYDWYMAGVIRGDGKKPLDFEQKLALHQEKNVKRKVA